MRKQVFNTILFVEGKPIFENFKEMVLKRRVRKEEKLIYNDEKIRLVYVKQVGHLIFIWTKFFYKDELEKGIEELKALVKLTVRFILDGDEEKLKKLNTYGYEDFLIFSNAKLKFKKIRKPCGILVDFE